MLDELLPTASDGDGLEPSAEKAAALRACLRSRNDPQRTIKAVAIGSVVTSLPILLIGGSEARNWKTGMVSMAGGLYGYIYSHMTRVKKCIENVANDNLSANADIPVIPLDSVNVYENKKNRLDNQKPATEIPAEEPMNLFGEFPAINENENAEDKPPDRTITYRDLRSKHRESYKSLNTQESPILNLWNIFPNADESPQVNEFDGDTKEPEFYSDQSIGDHKTKYGDVWD